MPTRSRARRQLVIGLVVVCVALGAWCVGRVFSPIASASAGVGASSSMSGYEATVAGPPASREAVGAYVEAVHEWLAAEVELLKAIGHGLEMVKEANANPQEAVRDQVEELSGVLRDPLPGVPHAVKDLSAKRENGDPTGEVPIKDLVAFEDIARQRPSAELSRETEELREATMQAGERTRAISRRIALVVSTTGGSN